ncbi:MAG TPA: hypothetical protein VFJ85_03025 [Acidimicrobiales bacterium]|nr:hypothetical protein [Acidimicrobiales bacterium]
MIAEHEHQAAVTYHDRLVAAAGIDPATLPPVGQRILTWLAGWDEPTTEGMEAIFAAIANAAGQVEFERRIRFARADLRRVIGLACLTEDRGDEEQDSLLWLARLVDAAGDHGDAQVRMVESSRIS